MKINETQRQILSECFARISKVEEIVTEIVEQAGINPYFNEYWNEIKTLLSDLIIKNDGSQENNKMTINNFNVGNVEEFLNEWVEQENHLLSMPESYYIPSIDSMNFTPNYSGVRVCSSYQNSKIEIFVERASIISDEIESMLCNLLDCLDEIQKLQKESQLILIAYYVAGIPHQSVMKIFKLTQEEYAQKRLCALYELHEILKTDKYI